MSNKLNDKQFYDWLINIKKYNFKNKSITILGAGNITKKYLQVISKMGISDVTIVSKTNNSKKLAKQYNYHSLQSNLQKNLQEIPKSDLIIIALPVNLLLPSAESLLSLGHDNILIEKPGSLYYNELIKLQKKFSKKTIHIAYNRNVYSNLYKLKILLDTEGGISSCKFSITEQIDRFNINKNSLYVYNRLGIANTLHVIAMVFELIGHPKKLYSIQSGQIKWHKSGSIFTGCGISEKKIPFSYHGDWNSSGGWGIEISTKKRKYLLSPLEKLFYQDKKNPIWKSVQFKNSYPDVKAGFAEEVALMLTHNVKNPLPTLSQAVELNKIAEKIFGYN